jgi:hypothetical protein
MQPTKIAQQLIGQFLLAIAGLLEARNFSQWA